MTKRNYDDAVAITRDIYWIGFYDKQANLHCNPYLLIDEHDAILFDPGSIPHFSIVMRKVIDLISPSEINYIVAAHQDPDVCGNLAVVEDVIDNKNLKIVAHTNTIRLIRHYGVRTEFYPVEKHDYQLGLKSGRKIDFIFTPFLHSPGAIMTYDSKSRSLFTSDVFGAISSEWELFGKDDYLEAMKVWHQTYMPSNQILANCMQKLKKLEIDRILPQHGSVLEGERVAKAIDYLADLPCGIDLS